MFDVGTRVDEYAKLEKLGPDIRTIAGGATTPVYQRPHLANQIAALLHQGKNVLLRGESGTGKTALVHSLPYAEWPTKATGQLRLVDTRSSGAPKIIETHPSVFIEGCQYCHDLENKMAIQLAAARAKPAIVFIDSIDECIGIGSSTSDPHSDVANLLLPHIDKGLQLIGATTPQGDTRLRSENDRLYRRFVVVDVPAPSDEEAAAIAELHAEALRKKGVTVPEGAVRVGLSLARRYLPGVAPLGGFLRLADRASARTSRVDEQSMRGALAEELGLLRVFVGCGAPLSHSAMTAQLEEHVLGQPQAVTEVADALVRYQVGLAESGRPAASFLFAGPSGCGKTSLALATARTLTGSEERCIRFDMSEYADIWSSERLIAEEPTSLVGRLRGAPAGVLLLDEIEKAHPRARLLLLQALGEARLTSERGKMVRLDNHIIMLTTNVGSRRWLQRESADKTASLVLSDCAEEFPPEFLARMTRTIVFRPLGDDIAAKLALRELSRVNELPGLAERGLQLLWSDALVSMLRSNGVSIERGARGLQSLVRATIVSPLARWLAENPYARDGIISVSPRFDGAEMSSLVIDWVDAAGFYAGTAH